MRLAARMAPAFCALALAAPAGLGLARPGAAAESGLAGRLEAALRHPALRGARVAALVVARSDGRVLFAREPDRALVPASNQKILTAVAALARFGPTYSFRTELLADAPPDAAGAVRLLAVRGGGDPSLTSEQLWRLAADLRARGLRRVRGPLVLDDSAFAEPRWHPSWGAPSARAYHAPVGALSVNYGAFAVEVRPGPQVGEPARVAVDPPVEYLRLVNRAITGGGRSRGPLAVERAVGPEAEEVVVKGSLPPGAGARHFQRSVLDPTRYAGAVLREQLAAHGIAIEGETRVGPVPEGTMTLLAFEGKPLAEIVRLFMKHSNNLIGETLIKHLGAVASGEPGSWENGIPALRAALEELGLATEGLVLADGSGLSYENRAPPRAFVEALRVAADSFAFGPEFAASLPIAAADGTLARRASGAANRVRAKTGLLTRVNALSGFARLADGSDAVFSLLVNGSRSSPPRAIAAIDGFVAALVAPD
jgi:D-alanyl-D-alanine carboxypeptidase/D-alanyl-D-alanine-endopeptidase (penicillin-binding protein 4)